MRKRAEDGAGYEGDHEMCTNLHPEEHHGRNMDGEREEGMVRGKRIKRGRGAVPYLSTGCRGHKVQAGSFNVGEGRQERRGWCGD